MTQLRIQVREYLADALAGLYALGFLTALLVVTPGSPLARQIGGIAFLPLGLVIAWLNFRNARMPGLDARTRKAWIFLACSSLVLWFSGNAWNLWVVFRGPSQYPPLIDRLALIQYALTVVGYLYFPSIPRPRASRGRYLLDVGLVVVAGFVLAFHFALLPMFKDSSFGEAVIASLLDWALFVVASVGLIQKRDAIARKVMGLLLAANCLYLLGNYVLAGLEPYVVGHPVDALWFIAWIFRWAAARAAWRAYRRPPAENPASSEDRDPLTYRGSAFSYLLVGGAFLLLILQITMGDQRFLGVLAFSAATMAGLLILRQVAELRENRRLFASHLAQEARFTSLVQNSSDVVLVVDEELSLTYVSASAERVFGGNGPVRVGARLPDLVPPEQQQELQAVVFSGGRRGPLFQGRMTTEQGAWRFMEIQANDLREDPAVGGIVLTCRDVTDRNELERQLLHAQKLDAVGKLAGGVAHDINNMLAVLLARLDLMLEQGTLDEGSQRHARAMEEAVQRTSDIVKQLLAFSRRQVVEPVVLDVNARIEKTRDGLGPLLGEEVQLELSLGSNLRCVKMDPSQWDQILMNLVINAKDASPGGGTIRVGTSNVHIEDVQYPANPDAKPGDYVLLTVTDHGSGMDAETQARIFEPFFTTKPMGKGTGLGLSTVFGIVTQSGGFVNVYSEPGHGSTFRIYLPVVQEGSEPRMATPAPTPVQGSGTVLLVEDNEDLRDGLKGLIGSFGYRVLAPPGVDAALADLRDPSVPIDLLLTDVIMPGMSGKELSDLASQARPGLRVLFMSGYTADVIAEKGVLAEGISFIQKPFTSVALRLKLQETLEKPA
jgi:PAS domain S-box-containing protein